MYFTFPKNFLFGAASSAIQIESGCNEGGKGKDVLDYYWTRHPEKYGFADPNRSADFYHRYPEDIKMMKELGLKAFRFSITWSRIYPNGPEGGVCQAGIDYYSDMIDKLIEADIIPFFDLFHCDLPYWVIERGGILNPEFIDWFAIYAETCFKAFGDRVKYWSTVNEPNVNVLAAYTSGVTPPFVKDISQAIPACHNMILAHFKAVRIYKSLGLQGKIGFVNHTQLTYAHTLDKKDQEAAERSMAYYSNWFTDAILLGHYPTELMDYPYITDNLPEGYQKDLDENFIPSDYFGINYYGASVIRYVNNGKMDYEGVSSDEIKKDDYGFHVNTQGIYDAIMYTQKRYPGLELLITENGIGKKKWGNYEEELEDDYRVNCLRQHLRGVARAVEAGAPVTGYFHWSIMDTNELYVKGYEFMYGLVQVRYDTLERVPRKSWYYYQKIIAQCEVD